MACDAGSGGWRGREGSKEEQGRWEEGRDYICALVGRGIHGEGDGFVGDYFERIRLLVGLSLGGFAGYCDSILRIAKASLSTGRQPWERLCDQM